MHIDEAAAEKDSHTPYAETALSDSDLYRDIVEHGKKFYHVGAVDYDKELPATITIVPEKTSYHNLKPNTKTCVQFSSTENHSISENCFSFLKHSKKNSVKYHHEQLNRNRDSQ